MTRWEHDAGRLQPRTSFIVLFLVALLALSWQSFVTQTHLDPAPGTLSGSFAVGSTADLKLSPQGPSSDTPAGCPICRDMAMSGHYLASAAYAFEPPAFVRFWNRAVVRVRPDRRQRSHDWQSRAPPLNPRP